jgi:membrane-anchored mycosin MYCP
VRLSRAGAAAAIAVAVLLTPVGAARADEPLECLSITGDSTPVVSTDVASAPLTAMRVEEAQGLFTDKPPGAGVTVAVIDSGVVDSPLLSVRQHLGKGTDAKAVAFGHGSVVAGLIAGHAREDGKPIGIAPGADLIDLRVYDNDPVEPGADPPQVPVRSENVAAALEWVADQADDLGIGVANISLAVPPSKALKAAVAHAWAEDVVVVAASGNRPQEGQLNYDRFGDFHRGEDARDFVFPADYDHVVAVNATVAGTGDVDLSDAVLQNSATDVAAPTGSAVSIAANGSTCVVSDVATSWATAEVSGVVALLRSRYDDESAPQIVARLLDTADGSPEARTPLRGAGVVQPVEALTRPLHPDGDGTLPRAHAEGGRTPRATPPEPDADVLAATREHAVWWGLVGGGALLLALLLRPVLARRPD